MWPLSNFGRRFARHTGSLELMDDLGRAVSGSTDALLLGGGNPGRIPAVERVFRDRLRRIADDDAEYGRAFANYAHPAGEETLRTAVAELLRRECGWPVGVENIAITAGSQTTFFLLFNLLAGDMPTGDRKRILLPLTPEYVGYADVGLTDDFFVSYRPAIEEFEDHLFKYRVDFDQLAVDDSVAAACVSRPTNPTGNVLTDNELEKLDAICQQHGVPLIIDAAYGLPFPGIVFTNANPIWNDNIVYCLSLSKLGLPAVRTGIVVGKPELITALTQTTAATSLAVGSVGAVMAAQLLSSGELVQLCRSEIRPFYEEKAARALKLLRRALAGLDFRIHKPEGALFLWLWLPGLPVPSSELYRQLKSAGVLVLSGHYFFPGMRDDWPHKDECLRISYAMNDDIVMRGIEIIGRVIRKVYTET